MAVATYRLTQQFPREETFGLSNQVRRASVSVASNIAEGWGRESEHEYKYFLGIARGSNCEVQTQLLIAQDLGFGNAEALRTVYDLSIEVAKLLTVLMRTGRKAK